MGRNQINVKKVYIWQISWYNISIETQTENKMKSGMYVVQFESGFKFGISININQRLRSYQKPWSQPIVNIVKVPMCIEIAKRLEKMTKWNLTNSGLKQVKGSTEFVPKGFKVTKQEILDEIHIYQRIMEEIGLDF